MVCNDYSSVICNSITSYSDDFYAFDDLAEVAMSRLISCRPDNLDAVYLSQMLPSGMIRRWEIVWMLTTTNKYFDRNVKSEAFLHMLATVYPDVHTFCSSSHQSSDFTQNEVSMYKQQPWSFIICSGDGTLKQSQSFWSFSTLFSQYYFLNIN